jgi:hypothetical protein
VINKDRESIIKVESNENGLLYTIKKVVEGIIIKQEDENNITTDLGVKLDERFNPDKEDKSDFNNDINRDEDM